MHSNYYKFKAKNHYDMGLQLGEAFKAEAHRELKKLTDQGGWDKKLEFGSSLLDPVHQLFPQYVNEIKGYAIGSQIDFLDFWTMCLAYDGLEDPKRGMARPEAHCTSIITNDSKLIGHNEDEDDVNLEDEVCLLQKEIDGFTTFEIYYYNSLGGSSIGLNSAGFVQSINWLLDIPSSTHGIPEDLIVRKLLDSTNPRKDFEELKVIDRLWGYNHNIVTPEGEILNIEFTVEDPKLEVVESPFAHTNHCVVRKTTLTEEQDDGTFLRLEYARKNVRPVMTSDQLMNLLSDTSNGEELSIYNQRTIASMVVDLNKKVALVRLEREKEKGWVEYSLDFLH